MNTNTDLIKEYLVFKENFVICWSGIPKTINNQSFLSRVNIDFITEQTKLFYSEQDVIKIYSTEDTLQVLEYITLNITTTEIFPLGQKTITFFDNGFYKIDTKILFDVSSFDSKILHHHYNSYLIITDKIKNNSKLSINEEKELNYLPSILLLCHLKGFKNALDELISCKDYFKNYTNEAIYNIFKETLRLNRKLKYNV